MQLYSAFMIVKLTAMVIVSLMVAVCGDHHGDHDDGGNVQITMQDLDSQRAKNHTQFSHNRAFKIMRHTSALASR